MPLFEIPKRAGKDNDINIAKKSNTKGTKTTTTVKGGGVLGTISTIKQVVEKNLGHLKDDYIIIQDENVLHDYITNCINNNVISLDTETTGLDPLLDTLVGICIYTPNNKAAYIPVNHVSYITGERVENQLSKDILHKEFQRVVNSNIDVIMFNACFDMRFMYNHIGTKIICNWDCSLASRVLNENEEHKNLKQLHKKYVLDDKEDVFRFDDLFNGITFDKVPINVGYLYAAHDAIITYELYEFQKPYLTPTNDKCINQGLVDVAWVFHNIEMPCVPVVADMENTGVAFDFEYNATLQEKYHKLLIEKTTEVKKLYDGFLDKIEMFRTKNPNSGLDYPINIDSPKQVAMLLYDILGLEQPIDKKTKKETRGTGEEVLQNLNHPICKAILDYREMSKLVGTYIDKMPNCVNPNDGRVHCKYNQYGADTGRFSSNNPNLQNIPSHNKDIRKMFKATDGYVLMSSDYSQQEPKVMAQLCGDEGMLKAYQEGKDLYAQIASLSFNKPYDECLEFRPDGTTNKEGKERRSQAKSILLGVLYGRGVPSIAEQLKTTPEKAQAIKDSVFKGFPAIPKFEESSLFMAENYGYVTTLWGRKRRLTDMQLPQYDFKWKDGVKPDNDLLDFDDEELIYDVPEDRCNYYLRKLSRCYFKDKQKIFQEANEEGIWIIDNGKKIADASRQCVNSRIQGSAADMSKLAMIKIWNDKRLRELGFRLLIPVHDELIGECPIENAKEVSERFAMLMNSAASDKLTIPISCDVEITKAWYGEKVDI